MKKRSATMRVIPEFKELAKNFMKLRVQKGLSDPKEFSEREFSELLMKTNSFPFSLEELKTKPKRRNL